MKPAILRSRAEVVGPNGHDVVLIASSLYQQERKKKKKKKQGDEK